MEICFHCGDECSSLRIEHQQKNFCCHGCKTVFDMLQDNNLSYYYDLQHNPGNSPSRFDHKFDFLQNESIVEKLIDFNEQGVQRIDLNIPSVHCSSCIWVLENLHKLNSNITSTQVNFPRKKLSVTYQSEAFNLHQLVLLLCNIGYEPYISLDDTTKKSKTQDRNLIYKLGVAGFAFGNIMFLSFPEYFEVNEFWLERYKYVFRWLMFAFSLPVVFYSSQDYIISAYKSLRSKTLNIDVPIALGIVVLFLRSTLEIVMDWGTGFLDSLAGLIFFLLLGKFFQQKTYAYLSFDRDYKSYFPVAVTRLSTNQAPQKEEQISVNELEAGDLILIRNAELLPVDGILIKGQGLIDYSFVTGEAEPVAKQSGDLVYAGGRQQSNSIEIEVTKSVEKSYLTQLWSNETFSDKKVSLYQNITDQVSKNFTISIVALSVVTTLFWLFYEPALAFNVFTAILIVACPCAIALAAPFTLGNMLRIFGRHKLYLKNSNVIEELAEVDTVVFDKTGTLTTNQNNLVSYEGVALTDNELSILTSTLRTSNHPLSRSIYEILKDQQIFSLDEFQEDIGQGIKGTYRSQTIKVGSFDYVVASDLSQDRSEKINRTSVYVSSNDSLRGCYVFQHQYREGVETIFKSLGKTKEVMVLSGDNDGERKQLAAWLPERAQLVFNQKPKDKLQFIKQLQATGKRVLMIGDGLNDAGALAQSDVGIAISENINVFSPACDGILDASRFQDLVSFISLSRKAKQVIKYAFIFSLFYNLIGLGFAITGNLQPVVAAILMPLSSISIVVFTSLYTYLLGKQLNS